MSNCTVCNAAPRGRDRIQCSDCGAYCHNACVNLTRQDVDCIVQEEKTWRCPPCSKARRQSMSGDIEPRTNAGQDELSRIISLLQEAKDDRRRIEAEMNKAFEFANGNIKDQKAAFDAQAKQLEEYMKLVDRLRDENTVLRKQVKTLEEKLEDNEQYLRSSMIEIQGVPEEEKDTYDVVQKIGTALGMNVTREMIDVCHRLGKPKESDRPAGIIVKFVRRETKQIMLQKKREKKNLSTLHIGYQHSSSEIYINDSLTPNRRKIFMAARTAKKTKGFAYVWTRNGKIFVRKEEKGPVLTITSLEDVAAL